MNIDEQTLNSERLLLKKDFDNLSDKIRQFEIDLGQMKGNLNALHGAIQQTDKLIKMSKE
jgi:hypothetical protein